MHVSINKERAVGTVAAEYLGAATMDAVIAELRIIRTGCGVCRVAAHARCVCSCSSRCLTTRLGRFANAGGHSSPGVTHAGVTLHDAEPIHRYMSKALGAVMWYVVGVLPPLPTPMGLAGSAFPVQP